jgi:hypothetical protein
MNRSQSIAVITETLATLDDAEVAEVAAYARAKAHPVLGRRLTPDELAGIERAKADFREGRTLGPDEYRSEMDGFMQRLALKYPAT